MERPNVKQWAVLWSAALWTVMSLVMAEDYVVRAVFGGWVVAALAYWQLSHVDKARQSFTSAQAEAIPVPGGESPASGSSRMPWFLLVGAVVCAAAAAVNDVDSTAGGLFAFASFALYYVLLAYTIRHVAKALAVARLWRAWVPLFQLTLFADSAAVSQSWILLFFVPAASLVLLGWLWSRVLVRARLPPGLAWILWVPLLNAPVLAYVASRRLTKMPSGRGAVSPGNLFLNLDASERTQTVADTRPPADVAVGVLEGPPQRRGSYLSRHWRGDLPLPMSYWVNGVVFSYVVLGLVTVLTPTADLDLPIAAILAMVIVLWSAVVVITVWQFTGIWRSAGKYVSRGGSSGWAGAARVATTLGIVQTVVVLATNAVPQVVELSKIASGHDPVGSWNIRVLRNASEVEVSGGIGFGLAKELTKVLDNQPTVKVVHLNSIGGRVAEARRVRGLILARGLSTYTATECLSACTIAFIAGRDRMIGTGRLGFHGYSFPGLTKQDLFDELAADRRVYESRGVSSGFVERAFKDQAELWYPTQRELVDAGVVTNIPDIDDVALSGIAPSDAAAIDGLLRQNPLMQALAEHDKTVFATVLDEYRLAFQRGDTIGDLRRRTLPLLQKRIFATLPHSSDDAVLGFTKVLLSQMAVLYKKDPSKCVSYALGGDASGFLSDLAPTLDDEQRAEAEVLRSANVALWPVPSEAEVKGDLNRLTSSLPRDELRLLNNEQEAKTDPAAYCRLMYSLYAGAVNLPQDRAGRLLRYFYAE